jgi:hypothetical protein
MMARPDVPSRTGDAPQEDGRVSADADVAVGEQDRLPARGTGNRSTTSLEQRRPAGRAGQRDGVRREVDPEHRQPALGEQAA